MTKNETKKTKLEKAFSYSKTGVNHIKRGIVNQDSIEINDRGKFGISIAVADGVSSCMFSKEGSKYAVEVISELLNAIIDEDFPLDNIDEIKRFIVYQWKAKIKSNWNDFATTLNFVIIAKNELIVGKIGDGSIYLDVNEKSILLVDNSDFYSSETLALGDVVYRNSITIQKQAIGNNLRLKAVLMTDGIAKEIEQDKEIAFLEYICDLKDKDITHLETELNAWVEELDRKNGDDKSIVIITMEECVDA